MHIVIVSRWYPPVNKSGGVAVYNSCLCRELVRQGHRATVIAAKWDASHPAQEVVDGVQVYRIRHPYRSWFGRRLPLAGRHMRAICQMLFSFRAASRLRQLEKEDPPDAVEFADIEAEGFAYFCGARRTPAVVRLHAPMFVLRHFYKPEEHPFSTRLISWMEKFCIRRADSITSPSRSMAARVAGECGIRQERIHIIPNGMEPRAISVPRDRTENGEFTVVHVGRLERAKGVEVLARAVPLVLDRVPNARFVYIGGAPGMPYWRRRLAALAGQSVHSGRITMTGEITDERELADWYRRADLAVVPSLLYESFSYTCAQAMAAGVAVVASRIGALPETLDGESCGVLVEPDDARALARAIIDLAGNPERRRALGQSGRNRAATAFAAERVARATAHVYASLARAEAARVPAPAAVDSPNL